MDNKNRSKSGKAAAIAGTVSATAGLLGGYQVCHNVCMGLIALLSLAGITVIGMPLAFLLPYAVPFWLAGAVLFLITLAFFFQNPGCVSKNLILLNAGVLVAAVPFKELHGFQSLFWVFGGALIFFAAFRFLKAKKLLSGFQK